MDAIDYLQEENRILVHRDKPAGSRGRKFLTRKE
jgi:hypothetical protein